MCVCMYAFVNVCVRVFVCVYVCVLVGTHMRVEYSTADDLCQQGWIKILNILTSITGTPTLAIRMILRH